MRTPEGPWAAPPCPVWGKPAGTTAADVVAALPGVAPAAAPPLPVNADVGVVTPDAVPPGVVIAEDPTGVVVVVVVGVVVAHVGGTVIVLASSVTAPGPQERSTTRVC